MHYDITQREFQLFRDFIYKRVGIALSPHKISLIRSRLSKRVRLLGLSSFGDYYQLLQSREGEKELFHFIDAISTNVTSFFRESGQWAFLNEVLPSVLAKKKDRTLRIWSAACSSGEEPYSIQIFLHENIPDISQWAIKILATDISREILKKAQDGKYKAESLQNVSKNILSLYFQPCQNDPSPSYQIKDSYRSQILFRMFNLVHGDFSVFHNKFDIIFCRNVMIYFDSETQDTLIQHFAELLDKDALLFVGHSESLSRQKDEFRLISNSIYKRI